MALFLVQVISRCSYVISNFQLILWSLLIVDNTTVYTFSDNMALQLAADDLVKWLHGLIINESKTRGMAIYCGCKFNKGNEIPDAVVNNSYWSCGCVQTSQSLRVIRFVLEFSKLLTVELGLRILFKFIVQLFALLYTCSAWHPDLSKKLSKEIECVQKRCQRTVIPSLSYSRALNEV